MNQTLLFFGTSPVIFFRASPFSIEPLRRYTRKKSMRERKKQKTNDSKHLTRATSLAQLLRPLYPRITLNDCMESAAKLSRSNTN